MKRGIKFFMVMVVVAILISLSLAPAIALAAPDGGEVTVEAPAADSQDFNLLQVLYATGVLAALAGVSISAIRLLKAWIDAKTAQISDDRGRKAVQQVNDAVFTAVLETAQLYADSLKKAAERGKLTDEDKQNLKKIAHDRAIAFISGDVWKVAAKQVDDLDVYINAQIEKYVRLDKQAQIPQLEPGLLEPDNGASAGD